MKTLLLLVALQQGLFAIGWWVAGWRLGLSRRAATHWIVATIASAIAVSGVLQRGVWPDFFTYVVANLMALFAFAAMRRGVQVFLRLPTSDRESAALFGILGLVLVGYLVDPANAGVTVITVAALMAWTMLRTAFEARVAMQRAGDPVAAQLVSVPLVLLGCVYLLRAGVGLWRPDIAARPLHEENAFNLGAGVVLMMVGLVLNLVLAYIVANRLVRRLQNLSQRDPLTALLNRRGLAPLLAREAGQLRRYGQGYAVMMLDIDHFKQVNDRHGHAAGDAALVLTAGVLRDVAREVDQVARVGGEEFCLLLPQTDLDGALRLGQRIQQAMRQAAWDRLQPPIDAPLTVSIGLAVAADAEESTDSVMHRADGALLRAKNLGRDRVVLAQQWRSAIVAV